MVWGYGGHIRSNKSIEIWDAATNQLVHAIQDAHERAPHALVINEVRLRKHAHRHDQVAPPEA